MDQFVYVLFHPVTDVVFYVGITINAYNRFKQHLACNDDNLEKAKRISDIKKDKLMPGMRIVEVVDDHLARERELYWIRHYLNQGAPLTNILSISVPKRKETTKENKEERESFISPRMLYRLQFLIMRACERKGYSIRRLARESGISHSHLSRVLNGITEPSREMIIAVCVPLDCSLEERTEIIHCMGYMTPEESEAYRERGEHPVVVWSKIA